jgi:hypothetical protein
MWACSGDDPLEGDHWLRCGFAVLDFEGVSVRIRYIEENNTEVSRVMVG